MTDIGHNSGDVPFPSKEERVAARGGGAEPTDDRLRLLVERIERLEEEKKGIADDIRDVYAEGKAVGYDTKIMRMIVRLRKMKPDDRAEMETMVETYKAALGLM
jgi:uncharacterized protein (UPF0335 family)